MSNAAAVYAAALESARAASRVFQDVQIAYRAGTIGDAEFLAARAVWLASEAAFDVAFDAARAARVDLDVRPIA